jgi:NADH-quinone oxidoreductase subunit G
MEGMNGEATPLNWSPGWNSGQAVLRYQDEVGGETRDSIMGVRLFADTPNMDAYFEIPTLGPEAAGTQLIPRWRVFGSDELSNLSPPIQARTAAPSVALHPDDAGRLGLRAGAEALCGGDDAWLRRRVEIDDRLPRGVAAVDFGFPGDPFVAMPGSGNVIDAAGRSR